MNYPKYIVSFDSFKGCLSSADANRIAADSLHQQCPEADIVQVTASDGGEGWVEAFAQTWECERMAVSVHDPLMRRVTATYLKKGDTAVIEIAQSSGLTLLHPDELNPLRATSYGVGEQIVDALHHDCHRFLVGLGGSATSDAGIGMIRALVDYLAPCNPSSNDTGLRCDAHFDDITALRDCHFVIGTDVTNILCGPQGAAAVFAPQKGANVDMVQQLDARAAKFARVSAIHFGKDSSMLPGSGAAGGLGYAFMQYLGATCQSGARLLLDTVGFPELLQQTTCVITGEGSSDAQTLMGKYPAVVLDYARAQQVPVHLLSGRISQCEQLLQSGFSSVESINPPGTPLEEALRPEIARRHLHDAAGRIQF